MKNKLRRRGALFLGVMLLVSLYWSRIPQYRAVYAATVSVTLDGSENSLLVLSQALQTPEDTDIVVTVTNENHITDELPEPIHRNVTFDLQSDASLWLDRRWVTVSNGANLSFTGQGSVCASIACSLNVEPGGTLTIEQGIILNDPNSMAYVQPEIQVGATLVLDGQTYIADEGIIEVGPGKEVSYNGVGGGGAPLPPDPDTPPTDPDTPPTDPDTPPTDPDTPPTDTTNPPADTTNPPTGTTNPPNASNQVQPGGEEPAKLPGKLADSMNGSAQFLRGVAYRLGAGNWRVKGDSTLYRGGNIFYVSDDGTYEFEQE